MKECYVTWSNNSQSNCTKQFVAVPIDINIRKLWCEKVGLTAKAMKSKASYFCCEDHFNVS